MSTRREEASGRFGKEGGGHWDSGLGHWSSGGSMGPRQDLSSRGMGIGSGNHNRVFNKEKHNEDQITRKGFKG